MATFARQTGAFVIAEGIEDEETLDFLRGVEAFDAQPGTIIQGGQGFELGRPSTQMPTHASRALVHLAGSTRAPVAVAPVPVTPPTLISPD
jgi:EAL domain-containing protein (putative c-di-GMP-specific phosphodiesterase class I)